LTFLIEHKEAINALDFPNCEAFPLFSKCSCLLSTPFILMTHLESLKTPVVRTYPLIVDGIEERERCVSETQRRGMNEGNLLIVIHESALPMILRFMLDSTDNRLQLASLLSLHGYTTAKL
jgi:hypothetical protein